MLGKWHRHIGVYGICINQNNEMLVIIKNGGPYDGLYDLPGGSFENPESISECLEREMFEKTLMRVEIKDSLGAVDILSNAPYNGYSYTHHIGLLYIVDIEEKSKQKLSKYVGALENKIENDSLGYKWIKINDLNHINSSPLILKACELINGDKNFELIKFNTNS